MFDTTRFRHPIVPIVDKERGFVSVFTLNVDPVKYTYDIKTHSYNIK